jgi:hypothetical protein
MSIDSLSNREKQLIRQFRKVKREHTFKRKLHAAPKYETIDSIAKMQQKTNGVP